MKTGTVYQEVLASLLPEGYDRAEEALVEAIAEVATDVCHEDGTIHGTVSFVLEFVEETMIKVLKRRRRMFE